MGEYWVIRHVDGTYGYSVKGRVQRARDAETLSREEAHAYRKKWNPGGGQLFVVHVTTKKREKADRDDVRKLYRASENQRAAITAERDTLVRELVAKQTEIDR